MSIIVCFLYDLFFSPESNKRSCIAFSCHVYLFSLNLEPVSLVFVNDLNIFGGSRLSVSWTAQACIDYYTSS